MPKPPNEAKDAEILYLAREDQIRLAEALIHPPKPSARLARAAQRHADLIADSEGLG